MPSRANVATSWAKQCWKAVLERIKSTASLIRKLMVESKNIEDVNKLRSILIKIHDIAESTLKSIADLADEPISTVLRHLASTIKSSAELVNYLVKKALFRGAIAGFASKMLGKSVAVIEIKCIAKGDLYCEFEVVQT